MVPRVWSHLCARAQNAYYVIKCHILHKVVDRLNPGKPINFEDQNFTNQVKYHEKELRRIQKGTSASKIFVLSERHRLLQYGVLIRKGRGKYVRWMVSERARDILETKMLNYITRTRRDDIK